MSDHRCKGSCATAAGIVGAQLSSIASVSGQEYALVGWGFGSAPMCDYSLHHVKSRPAKVGDKLVTCEFIGTLTRGFASSGDLDVAVCVLPGTELSFSDNVRQIRLWAWSTRCYQPQDRNLSTGQLRPPKRPSRCAGSFLMARLASDYLRAGQEATVLQLPATAVGSKVPQPLTYVLLPPINQ